MDTKAFHALDPKLKDTYERIMGTSVPTKTHTPPPKSEVPTERKNISSPHYVQAVKDTPHPPPHQTGRNTHVAYSAENRHKETKVSGEQHPKDSLLFPIVLGAGGVIFFIFYAIFWMSYLGM